LEDHRNSKEVELKVWKILDIFRQENISVEDHYLCLLFLLLGRVKILPIAFEGSANEFCAELNQALTQLGSTESNLILQAIPSFESIINKLSNKGLNGIIFEINQLNPELYVNKFSELFDYLLYRISDSQGRHGGEIIQPLELTKFLMSLADLPETATVFNPFAGLASFGVFLEPNQQYFGQELNERTWAIGQLRLIAYNRAAYSRFVCEDSIENWPDSNQKFDLIISHPPFLNFSRTGQKNKFSKVGTTYGIIDRFLIDNGIQLLSKNGRLIAILPQRILFGGSTLRVLRENLVNEDLLDTIISFPGGILSNTGIPIVVIMINLNKNHPGSFRLINGGDFLETKNRYEKTLNDTILKKLTNNAFINSEQVRVLNAQQIRENNYDLSLPRYFQKKINGLKLHEILIPIKRRKIHLPDKGKFVRIKNLKDDKTEYLLEISQVQESELNSSSIGQIEESCLLLSTIGKTLKPTWFEFSERPIFLRPDILAFKINHSLIDKDFLVNELHSDYVQEQLNSFKTGITIPFIRKSDLLEIMIKIPGIGSHNSLDLQRAKIQGILESSSKISMLEKKQQILETNVENTVYESFSSIKHSLGKPLLNMGSALRNIEKALSKSNFGWESIKLNERYDTTIKDSFDSIYGNLEFINSILKKNESFLNVENYDLTEIDFLPFIRNYVKRIKTSEKNNVDISLDISPDFKIALTNKALIMANTELLEIALNAIIENAHMHGFVDLLKKYKLVIRVRFINNFNIPFVGIILSSIIMSGYLIIEVANNGNPFPENFTREKLVRKYSFGGETGNTGQGGFDLNEIIKHHNRGKSTLRLITDDFTTEFKTTYLFLIPSTR
jgi:type I restriction enzyme M protein